jgi:hypothetical protein
MNNARTGIADMINGFSLTQVFVEDYSFQTYSGRAVSNSEHWANGNPVLSAFVGQAASLFVQVGIYRQSRGARPGG